MFIKFIGAARTVTGSQHLIEINSKKLLLDCGLYQGKRELTYDMNKNFYDYDPKYIDYMILSHAHIDHSGNIPQLIKKGFSNKIISTNATQDLCNFMLMDSAYIQEKDIEFVNKKRAKNGEPLYKPLYTVEEAQNALAYFNGIDYRKEFEIDDGINVTLYDAGHILGSSIVNMSLRENGKLVNLVFSGDLGRPNLAIIKDPDIIETPDYFILESTYGGRFHKPAEETEQLLAEVINRTVDRKGKIIIPAFSVGRTQEIVYFLHNLISNQSIPEIPIFIDSPLSVNITEVYKKHVECFDEETKEYILNNDDPFMFNQLNYVKSVSESKALNERKKPCIIISASGMCETGRILHHLRNNLENKRNTILIVGYNAEHTLGRKLVEKAATVKIFGEEVNVYAEIVVLNSLSAHADSNETINYMNNFDRKKLKKIFLVHGDYDQQVKLKDRLQSEGFGEILIPEKGNIFEIE